MVGFEVVGFCYAWQSEAEAREMTVFGLGASGLVGRRPAAL